MDDRRVSAVPGAAVATGGDCGLSCVGCRWVVPLDIADLSASGWDSTATQATDWAGNSEDAPTGDGDTWCEYREMHHVYLPFVLKNGE